MQLTREQRFAMSDYLKRQYLYSASWCDKVNKMPDNQLFAVFCRLSANEKINAPKKGISVKHETKQQTCEQLTIWDLMKGEPDAGDIYSAV